MMNKAIATKEDYTRLDEATIITQTRLPKGVTSLEISYDGGRLYVVINGVTIYETLDFGTDSCVTIEECK